MNQLATELREWIESNGLGKFEGLTGGGHLRYKLRNGSCLTTSSTPSKYSAVANAKSQVRRMLGMRSESPRAAKYRHESKVAGYDGRNDSPDYGMPPEVARLRSAVEKLDNEILRLHPRRDAKRLRVLAERRIHLADQLDRLGVPVAKPGIPAFT